MGCHSEGGEVTINDLMIVGWEGSSCRSAGDRKRRKRKFFGESAKIKYEILNFDL